LPKQLRPLSAFLGGSLLALIAVASVAAYAGQVAGVVQLNGPTGTVDCDENLNVTATILETGTGDPIEGQPVTFSFVSGNVAGDVIVDPSVTTDVNGEATTQLDLALVGARVVTIQAMADDVAGTLTITCSAAGLPRTATLPETSMVGMVAAAIAVLLGSGLILRRFATERR